MALITLPQGVSRKLASCWCAVTLAVFVAGCGGGGGSTPAPAQGSGAPTLEVVSVVARTGPIVTLRVGETANLEGARSITSSTEPISFSWSFTHKPDGSNAELQDPTAANPSFVADVRGTYVAQLVVSSNGIESQRALALVVATVPPEPGFFHEGLSPNCVNCHSDEFVSIPSKSLNHVATSNACAACHTPLGLAIIPFVDHQEVFGYCSECHNGILAIGKSEFHVPTAVECDKCHNTSHFLELELDGSFDHSTISRSCSGCHNGTISRGKTPTPPHPDTSTECGSCHTTESFLSAYPDHTGPAVVGNRCDSCHGVTAIGQSVGHPTTFVDCATCHGIATFNLGGIFNHRVVDPTVQPCESCHNDTTTINAPAKSSAVPPHLTTTFDCANCHNTESFAGAFIDHTGIVDDCASCHGVTAIGKPGNHMPTTEDCSLCHFTGTFTTGTYDHFGVMNNCESCHDNVITIGKLVNHLPTTADCSACHDTTNFNDATFDHVGIDINNCGSCHDGNISLGKPGNHVPTTLDCSSCHVTNDFVSFAGITFNHLGINPNNCAACHNTGIATPKIVNHIPAADECSGCHDSTGTFTSTTFLTTLHQGINSGCEGCHVSQFFSTRPALVKAAGHLPSDQDCSVCHTNAGFMPALFGHVGIADNCASCHDGNYIALGATRSPATPIHQNTAGDCSVCHNTTSFAGAFVDHTGPDVVGNRCDSCHDGIDATGKDAKANHVPTAEDCGTCHVPGGTFAPAVFNHIGIVDNCASCHDGVAAIGLSQNHTAILPTQDCSLCHNTTSFVGAGFNHQGIVDNCASCHNGTTATGKANDHVPTNNDCSDCHVKAGFLPATFDHIGIAGNCASCHGAGFATGKSNGHVPTNQDCGVCHNTTGFIPATFDHTGITNNCASCHGITAPGKSPNHISTTLDCSFCHTTATFVGGIFDHQGIVDGCSSCHDGLTAIGNEPQGSNDHFITVADCNACHTPQGWAPIDYTHPGNSDYPGDHSANIGCFSCHTGNDENISYRWNQYAPFCAACHAGDFERKGDHNGGENGTIAQNKDCSGGGRGCHRVSDRKFD